MSFGIYLCIVGCGLIAISIVGIVFFQYTKYWHTANGRITVSELEKDKSENMYHPRIEYQYSVGGEEITANYLDSFDAVTRFKSSFARSQAQGICNKYPQGKNVLVFYNPQNPKQACLEPGPPWRLLVISLVPGILFLLGGVYLIYNPLQ